MKQLMKREWQLKNTGSNNQGEKTTITRVSFHTVIQLNYNSQ